MHCRFLLVFFILINSMQGHLEYFSKIRCINLANTASLVLSQKSLKTHKHDFISKRIDKNLCLQTLGKPTNLIGTCHVEKALAIFCRLQLAVHWHRQSEYSYPKKVSISRHPSLFYVIIVFVFVCVCLLRVCILSSVCHTDTHREPEFSNLSLKLREKYLSKSRMPLVEVTVS